MMKTSLIYDDHHRLATDEYLPAIISVAKIGECYIIPTAKEPKKLKKEIDIKNITAEDLENIHRQDPFLYYSIPGVRSAKVLMKEVDTSNLCASALNRNSMCPLTPQSQQVTRSSCVSFECHPDLLLHDYLLNDDEDSSLENTEDPLDLWMLAAFAEQQ